MSRALATAAALLLGAGCGPASSPATPPPVKVENGAIIVEPGSPLLRNLEVVGVPAGRDQRAGIRLVGQIVALANPDNALSADKLDWVELDPEFTKVVGLQLDSIPNAKPGDVVGYTEMPQAYARKLVAGERVMVERYGLSGHPTPATVLFVRFSVVWGQVVPVVFRMNGERGWLPGSSCEVIFPRLTTAHFHIPTTALLHEGIREYVLKEEAPGRFVPSIVTIGDGDADEVEAGVGLDAKDRILARGAILLKPLLHDLLTRAKKDSHDR